MKKRILSMLLAFAMVLGMIPGTAFAAETELSFSGGTITLASGTTLGTATMTTLSIYKQNATSSYPTIVSATQDGNTINVVLAKDTDLSYPLQAGFAAAGAYTSHSGNTCTLNNGEGTMNISVQVKPAPAPNASPIGTGTFTVNFSVKRGEACEVTPPTGDGFTFVGDTTAYKDSSYTFTVAVNEGYDGTNMVVYVNGEMITGIDGTYTVENVTEALIITVEGVVKKEICTITPPTVEGVTFTGAESVYKGESYTFTLAVDGAHDATNMEVKAGETILEGSNGRYTIEAVNEDTTISVTGVEKKGEYTVTLTEGNGYTISGQSTSYAGEDYTFTVTVDDAIYFADKIVVKVDGREVALTDGKYTIPALDGDKTVTVENVAERQLFTVTKPEIPGVTVSGGDNVREGKSYTFSVAVESAYLATNMVVTVNGEAVALTDGSYTIDAVGENIAITIEGVVAKTEYAVTKPEVEGVTVTGNDTVLETDPYTFTVKVDESYDATNMVVKVNGETVTLTNGSYTIESASENIVITIENVAKKDICNVTIPTGDGFTVTGAETVYKGDNYTFAVTVNAGYEAVVTVNGAVIEGTNGSYTVVAVSEDLTISVEVQRGAIPGTEVTVTGNVIDIADNKFATLSSYHATLTGIEITGANISAAYQDGKTVYVLMPYTTEDDAAIGVEFKATTNRFTVEDGTGSVVLKNGEGNLSLTLIGRYNGSIKQGEVTYELIFIREEAPTEPPVCIKPSNTAEVWMGYPLEIDLKEYFTGAGCYYLVDGETKTLVDGIKYTVVFDQGGEQTLTFAAENEFGESAERLTVTVNVKFVESGIHLGYTTGNGSLDSVQFLDADGQVIEGIKITYDQNSRNINVVLPKNYSVDGTVKAIFNLTQNSSGYPFVSTSTETTANRAYNSRFTEKTIALTSGAANFTYYYYNTSTGATNNGGQTKFTISIEMDNDLPVLAEGVDATAEATITAGSNFMLDLSPIFTDIDGDSLTYLVSINGAAAVAADVDYTYTTDVAGTYTLVFTANDGKNTSTATYTVTLTVENSTETHSMTVSVPEDLAPEFYVSTGFGEDGCDLLGEAVETIKGETANGMTAYTVNYPVNAAMLSVRTADWGGMAFEAENGGAVTLRTVQMNVVDYDNKPAESTNTVTYDGHTAVAGTNGWLLVVDEEYSYKAVPKSGDLVTVTRTETLTAGTDTYTAELMLGINNPIAITVTTGAKAQVFKYDTSKYYFATELDAKIITDNKNGTTTYYFVGDTKNGTFIYHVTMPGKITKAGWMAWGKQSLTVTHSEADKSFSYRLDDYTGTGEDNSAIADDGVMLNINSRNHLAMSVGQTKTLKAYRVWEIIPISYQNYIITPDFTYTILSGKDVVSLTDKDSSSTADGDWMTLTALKEGVAIIEVTYGAMEVDGGQSYDGVYGASDPARTGLMVVQVGGAATVDFGIDCFAGQGSKIYANASKKSWDAEFDTLYFTGESGEISFAPTASSTITEVAVSNDKGDSWTILTGESGTYTAKIVPGNNILRVTTSAGTAYQVVRGDRVKVTLQEQTGDNDGLFEAGETVRVTINGMHSPIPKMAGNYNPGYASNTDGDSTHILAFTFNGETVTSNGSGAQYNWFTARNYIDITIPVENTQDQYVLSDGYIGVGVIGLTGFADDGDSHRNIPDAGCGTRGSNTSFHTRSMLPEITIHVAVEEGEVQNTAPVLRDGVTANAVAALKVGEGYTVDLSTIFTDANGDTLTYKVSVNGAEAVAADAEYGYMPLAAGTVTLVFTANDRKADSETYTVTLTVTEAEQPEEPEQPNEDNKVYISAAHDGKYVNGLVYTGVSLDDLAKIDLTKYGLGDYRYDVDKDGDYEITVLHLVIYAHETLCGMDWDNVRVKGEAGSIFFDAGLFGFEDGNLNYYVNGKYPLQAGSTSTGATADQIVLSDGDFVDISHYTDWEYHSDSNAGFHYFLETGNITHDYSATAGNPLEVVLGKTAPGSNYSTVLKAEPSYTVYYGTSLYQEGAASVTTDATGVATITFPSIGTWYLWVNGGYGADAVPRSIVSSPAYAVVTVTEAVEQPNTAPALAAGVNSTATAVVEVNNAYSVDLNRIFTDVDGDPLTYKVSVNGAAAVTADAQYSYTPDAAGTVTLVFVANDGNVDSESYTVTLTVKDSDREAADAVEVLIAAIGEVTLDSEDEIATARTAYNALTNAQKALVENYAVLTAAETKFAELKATAEDYTAADAVEVLIAAIGEVTLDSEDEIAVARTAYDALTATQMALVENYAVLTAAESKLAELKASAADQAAANAVEVLIAAIGEVVLESEKKITAARTAYDALTATQKALVENYAVLTAAESKLAELKVSAADQAAADAVEVLIAAIGEVTLDSEEKITAARTAYDALTDAQKALVANYSVLMAAETKLVELKAQNVNWKEIMAAVQAYLTAQVEKKAPVVDSQKGEWLVLGLARAGVSVDSEFFARYYENVVKYVAENIDASGRLHASKSTDNARVILALTAIGKDVTNVGGYNLLKGLSNSDYVKKQGVNGPIWALIALDSGDYDIPADANSTKQMTREWLIEYILSKQLANGGWSLEQTPDDMTPMGIQALAPYYESNAAVKTAVDKAITAMAGMVNSSFDAGNAETLAQIIVALSAMGIDADTDTRFSKNGISVVDALLNYSLETGAFQHGMGGGANQMATEQSFYALVAYDRFKSGKTSLYDMSDALAEKFSITVGEVKNGTVTVDKSVAIEGETVTVTVSAYTGYKLESVKMNGTALTVTDGKATFTMPAANVTITAIFAKLETVIEQETTVEKGSATVKIDEGTLKEAADAVTEENKTITIVPTETKEAEKVEVKLPAQTVGKISEEKDASIVVQAPAATVEIAKEILSAVTKNTTAESVISLIVEEQDAAHVADKTDEKLDTNGAVIVEVTMTVDGDKKTEFGNEKLTIFIPLSENFREGMKYDVVVISDGRANETHRSECRKVDGKLGVELKINHLSTFVVLDSAVSELLDAMVKLEVKDASKATYDKIMEIEAAYDALTNVQQDSLEDAYDEFCEKVEDFEDYLDEAIEDALDTLDAYYDSLDKDDYSSNNWKLIKDLRSDAKSALKKAPYQEQVTLILRTALGNMAAVKKSGEITVTFRLIGDFQHDNGVSDHDCYVTWIETTKFEMESGDTMYDLFIAAMDEFDLNQRGASNNYVETIQAPDILGGYWLGEFDNGVNSGWMYTVNGVHPNVGLCYYELQDGDVVVWHYVDDYKLEERNPSSAYYYRWLEAKDISPEDYVDELMERILTVGKHGKVDPAKLDSDDIGRNVTFRFKPDEGYKVENVIVDGKSMGSIESYTYKKLSLDSRITVTFVKKNDVSFYDVSPVDWFYEDVQFVVEKGLFDGTGNGMFSPAANMTRAMLVTVLYRLEGEPTVYGTSSFADVQNGKWYTDAVIWAAKNGIVGGYDNGLFGTNDNVTREQMAAILFRYASYKGYSVARNNNLSQYADAGEIHSYALSAMKWANAVGLINGRTNSTLVPGGTATRAEVAAIFHRFVENLVP